MLRDIEGVRLNVLDEGAGQAVVFLHGLGGCWRDWEPQVESWRSDHRVVAIEHRGHGRSDRVPGPYSTDQFAADALAACRQLGVDHAYVVGLSMGGMVAQKMALADPGFLDALVLCDTFLRTGSAGVAGLRSAAGLVRAEGLGALATLMSEASGAWPSAGDAGAVTRNNLRDAEGNDPDCWAAAAEAICDHDVEWAGRRDRRCGAVARRVGRRRPRRARQACPAARRRGRRRGRGRARGRGSRLQPRAARGVRPGAAHLLRPASGRLNEPGMVVRHMT